MLRPFGCRLPLLATLRGFRFFFWGGALCDPGNAKVAQTPTVRGLKQTSSVLLLHINVYCHIIWELVISLNATMGLGMSTMLSQRGTVHKIKH